MSTSEREVAQIITEIDEGRLELAPFFQRRLVWTNRDREFLIDTVLNGFPFPEIFIATSSIDTVKVRVQKMLVDGQQRVTTLRDYVKGMGDFLYKTVKPFGKLTLAEQSALLHYKISVRDLGQRTNDEIRSIFHRINSTDFSLKQMEILNARYSGEYMRYCGELTEQDFFLRHKVFSKGVSKRMGDVAFCVILVTTLETGYYNRDEKNEEFIRRYNDEFPDIKRVQAGLDRVFDFIDECKLPEKCRAWKQTDLFTLIIELHHLLITEQVKLNPTETGSALAAFYDQVNAVFKNTGPKRNPLLRVSKTDVAKYLKAATKATNDKYARVDRGEVLETVLRSSKIAEPKPRLAASKKG
jgi:Protein of unknown function DUF262